MSPQIDKLSILGCPASKHPAPSLITAAVALLASSMSFAQQPPTPGDSEVTRIERREDTRAAQDANKFNTREKRLREKALDWNATKGTPTDTPVRAPTDAAQEQPGSAPGGAPDPNADDRARRFRTNGAPCRNEIDAAVSTSLTWPKRKTRCSWPARPMSSRNTARIARLPGPIPLTRGARPESSSPTSGPAAPR
jgi:hypothetical protein